jgi:subtilisin family serine protease
MSELKEYAVTTQGLEDTDSVWDDLTTEGSPVETIPNRVVEVTNERAINTRNTTYLLTEEEAQKLKEDSRVQDVTNLEEFVPIKFAFQDGTFDKTSTVAGEKQNWGLLRHISATNVFGTSTADPGGTYDYVLDGTGVDIVIIDSGIQANHPEFQDASGASRVQQINWFTASGVGGTMPTGHYTDYDGHGTHVAATVAGKTFGWAKNAHIYSIKLDGLQGSSDPNSGISYSNAFDCILGWHLAKTNGRPTILNNSWGFIVFWETAGTDSLSFDGVTTYPVTGGVYRGTPWSAALKDTSKGLIGQQISDTKYVFPYKITSADADIEQLIDAGIIVCTSAGNNGMKHDVLGGTDYNNYVTATGLSNYYYHRGSSPHSGSNPGLEVGSTGLDFVSSTEAKSAYSGTGPGVDIYAAGDRIISAMSSTNAYGSNSPYYIDSNYKQHLLSGTSMACPQVAGICALLKQVHLDWTPQQVKSWVVNNAKDVLYSTGEDNDYANSTSILGGVQKLAYMPMSGQLVYRILEV